MQLDRANQNLADTTRQLQVVRSEVAVDQNQLAQLLVHVYELTYDGSITKILVDSKSFQDAMDTLRSVDQVSSRVQTLITQIRGKRDQLTSLQKQQTHDQQRADALVASLVVLAGQQQTEEAMFKQQASSLKGKAATLLVQYRGIQSKIAQVRREQPAAAAAAAAAAGAGAARMLGNALPPFAFGPQNDWFPWGQCTWYAASLRNCDLEWRRLGMGMDGCRGGPPRGNEAEGGLAGRVRTGQWLQRLRARRVCGGGAEPTSFTIDEGNFLGLGVIDQRQIWSLYDVEAFIY